MASTTSTPLSISSSSAPNSKAPHRLPAAAAAGLSLPTPTPTPTPPAAQSYTHVANSTAYCRKIARNVVAMATGEAPAEVIATTTTTTETPEIVKTIQEAWDKVDDKYAVTSLAVAGGVALWASAGMISAIDRLPLVPGVLELVGIGYTGWFAYKNLASKPEREALIKKIKDIYSDIVGSS